MRSIVLCRAPALLALGLALLAGPAVAAGPSDDYHSFAEVEGRLQGWAKGHQRETELSTIGRSAGGRPIYLLRVAGPGAVDPDARPAVFVGANVAGFHNAGTEAALHLVEALLAPGAPAELLASRTFYVAPALNPDAHDGLFATPRVKLAGNASRVDHDRDGLLAEDGPDDLDGDGRITMLRIPDPAGRSLPHPDEPRLMIGADAAMGRVGAWRLVTEGKDDDGDGEHNEDGTAGVAIDRNFPHAFPYPDVEAGPWPSSAPETKAVLDFLLARRNVALAVVYGPANNLLAAPQSLGGGGDLGTQRFRVPERIARSWGLDPEVEYTLDEVWEIAKDLPFVRQNNFAKDRIAQFLGAGPATRVDAADQAWLDSFAEGYKERLKKASLPADRPAAQYGKGGLTPWLYYQYGVLALELDVWGIPKAEAKKDEAEAKPGEEPRRGGGKPDEAGRREREVLAWLDEHAPGAVAPWTAVTLPDGTRAEAGGLDPFAEVAPPMAVLEPALAAHTETVLDLAGRLARLEVLSLDAHPLGAGVYRVRAVAGNRGALPTHTRMAERAKTHRPVRLELLTGTGVELVTGRRAAVAERLDGATGTLAAEWLVRAEPGARIAVEVVSDNAGRDAEAVTAGKGK